MSKNIDQPIQNSITNSLQPNPLHEGDSVDLPPDLTPTPAITTLLAQGRAAQSQGETALAAQRYAQAAAQAEELGDSPGYARSLAQLAALEEACGEIDHGLAHNEQAIEAFLQLGDGAGLVQAYRLNGFLQLRRGQIHPAAASFAQSLGMALQVDTRLVITTLNQVLPALRYLIESDQVDTLLPMGAALQQAVDSVAEQRGEWPDEMADFAEIARTVASIWPPLGVMAEEPDLSPEQRRSLAARATHQAWMVDALTRRRWNLADLVRQTLTEKLNFQEKLE